MLVFSMTQAMAQTFTAKANTGVSIHSNGFYEYLPNGYNSGSDKYPLLIFIHDLDNTGNGSLAELPGVLSKGLPKLINDGGFPASFIVNSTTYKFIILAPQFSVWPKVQDIEQIIDYAIQNYRVDESRIYLTGVSMGGAALWNYAGLSIGNSNKIAAMVPVCGDSYPQPSGYGNMASTNLPVWATHNALDGTVPACYTSGFVSGINSLELPSAPTARSTIFAGARGHDAWTLTYDPTYKEGGLNIYEWMLQYDRPGVLAVAGLNFTAKETNGIVLLNWTVSNESLNNGFTIERSSDGSHFETIAFIPSQKNTQQKYSYPDNNPVNGKNFYRLKMTSQTGSFTYSEILRMDFQNKNHVTLFPSIVTHRLNLQTNYNANNGVVKIFDMSGKTLLERKINGYGIHQIEINLPSGIYSVVLIEKGKLSFRQTIIKQ